MRAIWPLVLLLWGMAMPAGAQSPPLRVFAASSLQESLNAVAADWTAHSQQRVLVNYAASSLLAKQIEELAPADVFVSADQEWMDYLQQRGRVEANSRFDLVGNRLVLIAPVASSLQTLALADAGAITAALGDSRLAVAETASVPAGRYARQALVKLGAWDALSSRLAQADNVRGALAFVARGEAPLGIVYATDARAEPKVRVVATFAEDSHDPIIYPVARVVGSDAASAQGFLDFLRSAEAQAIFTQAGFSAP